MGWDTPPDISRTPYGGYGAAANPFLAGANIALTGVENATSAAARERALQAELELRQQAARQQQQDAYQQAQLAKSQEDRTSLTDALKKLATSEYRANWQGYAPPTFHSDVLGKSFTGPANIGLPGPMSDYERAGTAGAQQEIMKRLAGNSTVPIMPPNPNEAANRFTIPENLRRRGILEKIGSFL